MTNLELVLLQQPGAAFVTGGATPTGPNWAGVTNPQYSQGLLEFCTNEGYKKVMGDLEALELALVEYTFSSTANTYKYAFPPTGYAQCSHLARLYYKPYGLPYTREFRPGTELVGWSTFQRITGQGYLDPYSYGTQPLYATVDPLRQNIYFYPGSARAGDTVTVDYTPIPTPYTAGVAPTGCPILVNATDTPILPADCHMAIVYYALSLVWIRARETQMAEVTTNQYTAEIAKIKDKYTKVQHGDTIRVEPFGDRIAIGGGGM
ncbi:MAG: hypothetical protein WAN50_03380 [Minisyncoccia bacterium]